MQLGVKQEQPKPEDLDHLLEQTRKNVDIESYQNKPSAEVRQLAAVMLRKRIGGHWRRLSIQVKQQVESALQDAVLKETVSSVRRAIANCISGVARHAVPLEEWPCLLDWLHQCSRSPQQEHREVALLMFSNLIALLGTDLRQHFAGLVAVVLAGLQDSSPRVRSEALQAVASLAAFVGERQEAEHFQPLVPAVMHVAQSGLSSNDEDLAILAFEIFGEMAESPAPIIAPMIPTLVAWCVEVAKTTTFELNTREQALQIVHWLARFKPKQLTRGGMVRQVVLALCALCAEPIPADYEEGVSEPPANKFAAHALDTLALNLPNKHVFPDCLMFARRAITTPDAHMRVAACSVLLVISEGCADAMGAQIEEVLEVMLAGLRDAEAKVKEEACHGIAELAIHCQPDVSLHYKTIMPPLFAVLHDASPAVQEKACYALEALCEQLSGEEIAVYIDPLMHKLLELLQTGSQTTQQVCLSAIASAAAAAQEAFKPYAAVVLPYLRHFMQATDDSQLKSRARATECLGLIVGTIGKEDMLPLLPEFVEAAFQGLTLDYSELREYTHGMFGMLAKLLGADFVALLPRVVPAALASLAQEDGEVVPDGAPGTAPSPGSVSIGSDSSGNESDDDSEVGAERRLSIRTGVLDEKAAATEALGLYADHTGAAFMPFLEDALKATCQMAVYFHEVVRELAYETCACLLRATIAAFPHTAPGEASSQARHVVDTVYPLLLAAVDQDDDKDAVAEAMMAAGHILKAAGASACARYVPDLAEAAAKVLRGEAVCQAVDSDEEEGEEADDEDDSDEDLLTAVAELLPIMAGQLGPAAYAPIFHKEHCEPLLARTKASQPDSVRAAAVGTLAEVAKEIGPAFAPVAERLVPILVRELRCDDSSNQRNAAFCVGMLFQHAAPTVAAHYPQLLQALHPLFSEDADPGVRDNAAGAVGRLIIALGAQLPLEQILPVLLGALPLTADADEADAVYGALCTLTTTAELAHRLVPFLPATMQAFGAVVLQADVKEEMMSALYLIGQAGMPKTSRVRVSKAWEHELHWALLHAYQQGDKIHIFHVARMPSIAVGRQGRGHFAR
ncbi:hypothetical protein WJX72_012191 [[Myrmecia] bisecta]|uniref:Importin N-terminal domain-containing protein n=1 Tax=[Myrmecia] bisecta TaxID=41462 RepID=A0AAW1QT54_9CHLO